MDPSEFGFTDFYGEEPGQPSAIDLTSTAQPPQGQQRTRTSQPMNQPAPPTDRERRKAEAKHRIRLAGYYEAAQESELFEDMSDVYARQVQAEVAAFLEQRIEVLTGVGEAPPPAQFSAEEVQALKALAKTLLSDDPSAGEVPQVERAPAPLPPPPPERKVAQAPQQSRPTPRKAPVAKPEPARATQAPPPAPAPSPGPPNAPAGRKGGRKPKVQAAPPPAPEVPPKGRIPFPTGLAMSRAMEMKAHEALASAQVVDTGTTEVKSR
jgi:hypothetical protein